MRMESDNWIVQNLERALGVWNSKLREIWALITQTPDTFKDGAIWAIIKDCIEREAKDGWLHWCCPHPNKYTGKPWGEGYIHKVVNWEWWIERLTEYNRLVDNGLIRIGNDWSINRYLYGWRDLIKHSENIHDLSEYDVYWHDETDDFDFPIDYDRFMEWTHRR